MADGLLSAHEVCVLVGCSIYTLNRWYKFKEENPDSPYSKKLPEIQYKDSGKRRPRYWKNSDIWKLIEFKTSIPKGCKGVLGSVSHLYDKKSKTTE